MIRFLKTNSLALGLILAFIFFFLMFSPLTAERFNFWILMSSSALVLGTITVCLGWGGSLKNRFDPTPGAFIIGILSACLLWFIFYIGNKVSGLILPFSGTQISSIYAIKHGSNPIILSGLLLLLIGPAEEIFWRGFVQDRISKRYNRFIGMILASLLYTLVHIWSFNLMLILAALVAGFFWGFMYMLFPKNLIPLIISHALWDAMIFIWFPV